MRRDELNIPTPCQADWTTMTPADRSRFCGLCSKHVHDLSTMTEGEARALMSRASTESLCVRYLYDARGHVFFAPEVHGAAPEAQRRGLSRLLAAAGVIALSLPLSACMGAMRPPMGEMMPPPEAYTATLDGAPTPGVASAPDTQTHPTSPTHPDDAPSPTRDPDEDDDRGSLDGAWPWDWNDGR